jgi:hypothetical protein
MTYYVSTIDTFMSGWGEAADLENMLIFVCDSLEEAEIVAENAENRSDQKRVTIHHRRPNQYKTTKGEDYQHGGYYIQIKTKGEYSRWYEKGAF